MDHRKSIDIFLLIFFLLFFVNINVEGGIIGEDDRIPSNDLRIGRITYPGALTGSGTAWLMINGALVTAKHNNVGGYIEFKTPLSNANGTINHASSEDTYQVDILSKIDGPLAAGSGYDFTVFSVLPNSETGYLPLHAYRKAFRVYDGAYPGGFAPSQVRVTGYGKYFYCTAYDCIPSELNYVQQTALGSYVGLVDLRALNRGIMLYHDADTDSGNSGSPIRDAEYESVAIGIQCVGPNDCIDFPGTHNCGPSFLFNTYFIEAVNSFTPTNTVYIDQLHPFADNSMQDGSVFRPFHSVAQAVAAVPEGGIIGIVSGQYNERMLINKAMRLVAPVGVVRIGQ